VTMVGQVHHDLISVTVLDDLDLTLCPSGLFLAAHLVGLKYAKKVWELRREVDCLFAPYLGVAANSAVQVHLWIDAEWGLHSGARNLVLEVRLDDVDRHAERVVVVAEGHLVPGVQLALLYVGIGNLGALARELLRLVGGDDARGTVDARHRAHDLCHVASRRVDHVGNDRLGPCIRHGPRHHRLDVAGANIVDIALTLVAICGSTTKALHLLGDLVDGQRHVPSLLLWLSDLQSLPRLRARVPVSVASGPALLALEPGDGLDVSPGELSTWPDLVAPPSGPHERLTQLGD